MSCRENTDLDQRTNILVLDSTFARDLMEPSSIRTIPHGLILQVTLTTLITDWTIKGMVCQQELHDTFTSFVYEWGTGLDHHSGLNRPCTRSYWLWNPFHLHQTHSTISGNQQFLMIAVSGDGSSGFLACLDEGGSSYMELVAVDRRAGDEVFRTFY